jgi:HD superfamily phosphohydrolase
MHKRAFIKDPLWGNIEFFSWESCVTNHFIFNRLTNIIQNSSAFRAYPGLKYSRFLHTIGVVHVVTQLFTNSLKNAKPKFLRELRKEAKKADGYLTKPQIKFIRQELLQELGGNTTFAVLLASLRMSAFMHDLGHLPYSHVFENALESFISPDIKKTIHIAKKTKLSRATLIRLLKRAVSVDTKPDAEKTEPEKIHERVGIHLANALQEDLGKQKTDISHLCSSLIHSASDLQSTDSFPISKTFIKGTVDADRIDFIRRDGHFSGLFSSSVDCGRLFTLYTLEETMVEQEHQQKSKLTKGKKAKGKIVSCPSFRAVSETEKLLWERFQDYKYIVMHHKVHLYDEVVENILVRLLANGKLNKFLRDLIYLLGGDKDEDSLVSKKRGVNFQTSLLLEFDDPWLESYIRSTYRQILDESENVQGGIFFEVYVEQRKRFTSAFKSDFEFWKAVADYAPRFSGLLPTKPILGEKIRSNRDYFFAALYKMKFSLQALLEKKLGYPVIIGPTERKVNYGIRDENEAAFYQISELLNFLKLKKYGTMLFNLWFDSKSHISPEAFQKIALPIIENVIFKETDGIQGITELDLQGS